MTPTKPMTAEMAQACIEGPWWWEGDKKWSLRGLHIEFANRVNDSLQAIASGQHAVIEAGELERLRDMEVERGIAMENWNHAMEERDRLIAENEALRKDAEGK